MNGDIPNNEGRLRPPTRGVTLRLYRQGLGDCFLLAFPREEKEPFYLLIDCGVILGTPEPKLVMDAVVRDIAAATGGRIDLLVITHEHWDHVSGFVQARQLWTDLNIHIESVWMAWTEDMSIPLALRLKQDFQNDLDALRLALDRMGQDAERSHALSGVLGLFGDPFQFMAAAKAKRRFSEATHEALKAVRELAGDRVTYRAPGETHTLPGVPGVRVYILGPPQNERALRNINPSRRTPQTYTHGPYAPSAPPKRPTIQPDEKTSFTLALKYGAPAGMTTLPLTDLDEAIFQQCFPFAPQFRVSLKEAAKIDFFRQHYGIAGEIPDPIAAPPPPPPSSQRPSPPPGPAWRRIDHDFEFADRGTTHGRGRAETKTAEHKKRRRPAMTKKGQRRAESPPLELHPIPDPEPPAENVFPFDQYLRVDLELAAQIPFFWEFYGFEGAPLPALTAPGPLLSQPDSGDAGAEWRRIDTDWLGVASEVALQMDSYTNNTSLAMAIELVGTGKVLLFPADAQVGNWLSWDAIEPALTGNDGKPVAAADLLRRVAFYKVGHHGSHNATMREAGLERMVSPDMIAFVPVDERVAHDVRNWREMPFEPLLAQLYEATKGRVIRLDRGVVTDDKPDFLSEDVWRRIAPSAKAFRDERVQTGGYIPNSDGSNQPLYFQLEIVDTPGASETATGPR
jgi:hypothetical protein